jgi:hypothetical protein
MSGQAKKRLGELLIEAGVIDDTQLKAALGHQRQWGVRIGQALVDLKLATEPDVVKILAKKFGFEVARLDQVEAYGHQQAMALVPREFAAQHNVFPLAADSSTLSVAMSDPTNLSVVDELRFRSGRRVKVSIGGDREIAAAIKAAYPSADGGVEAIALEIDESGSAGESVMGSFGGGSSDDFDSFFGADAAHGSPHPEAGSADDPFSAEPLPVAAAAPEKAAPPGPPVSHAPFPAPFPVPLNAPPAAPALPRPGAAQLAPPAAAAVPVIPRVASAPAARPAAPRPGQVQVPPPAASGQPAPGPAAPGRKAAVTLPAMRAVQPPPPVLQPPAPAQAAARPPAAAPPRAQPLPHPLEALLSPDAVQAARALRGQPAARPVASPPPRAPVQAPASVEQEEELTQLPEAVLEPVLEPLPPAPGELTAAEQAVLDALERLADGGHAEPEVLKPTQAIAVLIRILLRKGVVDQREILEALRRDRAE